MELFDLKMLDNRPYGIHTVFVLMKQIKTESEEQPWFISIKTMATILFSM